MAFSRKTRSSSHPKEEEEEEVKPQNNECAGESKVFFIDKSILNATEGESVEIIDMRHPRTGVAKFIIHHGQIFELMEFREEFRSWLISGTVVSNGRIYITTNMDPLFLALPFLTEECVDRAIPMSQLFTNNKSCLNEKLQDILKEDQLNLICDIKRSGDIVALKYNEDKALDWLAGKCEKIMPVLLKKRIHCGSAATSANFVKSEKIEDEDQNRDEIRRYAFNIVSDYLTEDMVTKLQQKMGITMKREGATDGSKRKSVGVLESTQPKKSRAEDAVSVLEEKPAVRKAPEPLKVSAKSKAMQKAASGSKSISSFFKKS